MRHYDPLQRIGQDGPRNAHAVSAIFYIYMTKCGSSGTLSWVHHQFPCGSNVVAMLILKTVALGSILLASMQSTI